MAIDYAPLVSQWASITTANPGFNTAQKLAAINALTVTGAVPTSFTITGLQLMGAIVLAEFTALTANQQTQVLSFCAMPVLSVGTASTFVQPALIALFGSATATRANLLALAKGAVQPWWVANNYTSAIGLPDLALAGGLT
jgi:hypothetical protein